MRAAVLGAGAMGCLVGAHLKKGGAEVCFVDPYEAHMEAVAKDGLVMDLEGRERETVRMDLATCDPSAAGLCDLVIVLVKGMSTEEIVEKSPQLFGPDTVVMSLQNGLGNVEILERHFPKERIGYGVLKASASLLGPGRISGRVRFPYSPKGVFFSPVCQDTRYLPIFQELEAALERGGFPAALSQETESILWDKLYINILYNAPCALVQLAGEDFMRHPQGKLFLRELAREVCAVANAKGIPMDDEACWAKECANIGQVPPSQHHFTSTVMDVYKQRKTEIDFLNGAICREGEALGIPTPYNRAVYWMTRVREDTYYLIYPGPDAQ